MSTERPAHNHQKLQEIEMCLIENKTMPGAGHHAYNPSYSGGRDQEDHSLKPCQQTV
jgi:hypothetical protein